MCHLMGSLRKKCKRSMEAGEKSGITSAGTEKRRGNYNGPTADQTQVDIEVKVKFPDGGSEGSENHSTRLEEGEKKKWKE